MTAIRLLEPSGSNGSIQFALDGDFSSSSGLVFVTGSERLGIGTAAPDARLHVSGSTILGGSAGDLHQITGSVVFATGLSGSLTHLADGRSYLVAGDNVTISTGSNGQITISAAGSGYGSGAVTGIAQMSWMETPSGPIDGLNMIFSLAHAPSPKNSLMLYVNGVLQSEGLGKDYDLSTNSVMTMTAPTPGTQIVATYSYVVVPDVGTSITWMEVPAGTIDGINTHFVLAKTPHPSSALMLYYNGVLQRQGPGADYLLTGEKSIITSFTPEAGSNMSATYPY